MSIFLLKTSTLTINRYLSGYHDINGDWVQGGLDTPFDIECNIQPYREGKQRIQLPEGTTTNDVVLVYSKTKLNVADQFTQADGDYFSLDGFTYKIYSVESWDRYGLIVDHTKHYAIRKDLPTNGDL